jgi:hypothetical protein
VSKDNRHAPGAWHERAFNIAARRKVASREQCTAEIEALIKEAQSDLLAALAQADIAVEQLCHGQDPANECWNVLRRIRAALAKESPDARQSV